jgi:hypothetical protein
MCELQAVNLPGDQTYSRLCGMDLVGFNIAGSPAPVQDLSQLLATARISQMLA